MAIASNRTDKSVGPGRGRGEVSGLNCHIVLRPIDAALDETSTGASPCNRCALRGGHFSDVTHCDVILLHGRRAHVGMTTVNRLISPRRG